MNKEKGCIEIMLLLVIVVMIAEIGFIWGSAHQTEVIKNDECKKLNMTTIKDVDGNYICIENK